MHRYKKQNVEFSKEKKVKLMVSYKMFLKKGETTGLGESYWNYTCKNVAFIVMLNMKILVENSL